MDDKPSSIFQKAYEELKAGNPIAILIVLLILVLLGGWWVWQTTHNPVVSFPTPRFRHPSAVSPIKVLTVRALSAVRQARATATPIPLAATPTPTPTRPLTGLGNWQVRCIPSGQSPVRWW